MELGHCPRCGEGYTASQVAGLGILRSREARAGGPRVEYECHVCAHQILLIPHGKGRYAPPGQPPPHFVPEADRQPSWIAGSASRPRSGPTGAAPPSGASRPPEAEPKAPRESAPGPQTSPGPGDSGWEEAARAEDPPIEMAEALALLGCDVTADKPQIERAFRERSLTCHPDKVAHLDPDFQELAERKFKRLKAAFDLLTT